MMDPVKRLVASVLALSLATVGLASAGRGDPQKQFTRADQARAKLLVLRKSDFPATFEASKRADNEFDFYCKALDESKLVVTGEAESLDFLKRDASKPLVLVAASLAQVYKTGVQSAASWRQGTSPAGWKCLELGFRQGVKGSGVTLVSLRRVTFPRVAPGVLAFRVTTRVGVLRVIFDYVVLRAGRAQVALVFTGAPSAFPRADQVRLAEVTARRMADVMRTR